MMESLVNAVQNLSSRRLKEGKERYMVKVNDPKMNGRLTAGESMDLDHWHDMIDLIDEELKKRKSVKTDEEQ